MAGLLDTGGFDNPNTIGLLSLGARLSNSRGGFMQALAPSVLGALGDRSDARGAISKQDQEQLRMQILQAQLEQHQAEVTKANADALRQAAFRNALQQGMGGVTGGQAASVGGPTPGNAALIGQRDPNLYQNLAVRFPEQIKAISDIASAQNLGKPKVARTMKGVGPDGREFEYQTDEFGNRIGEGLPQYRAPIQADSGGAVNFLDPYSLKPVQTMAKTMTPDGKDASARGWATVRQGDARLGLEREKIAIDKATQGAAPKMTEDQAKASGWLIQATNAFGNMKAAMKNNPGAAEPGFLDALSAIPSLGLTTGIANSLRSTDRQKFMQGASSLSEALLRAATGAGVNKDEAAQKVRELTPVFGDDAATIKQKTDAIPLYIEALKMRAGPGAAGALRALQPSSGATGGWDESTDPLGLRK